MRKSIPFDFKKKRRDGRASLGPGFTGFNDGRTEIPSRARSSPTRGGSPSRSSPTKNRRSASAAEVEQDSLKRKKNKKHVHHNDDHITKETTFDLRHMHIDTEVIHLGDYFDADGGGSDPGPLHSHTHEDMGGDQPHSTRHRRSSVAGLGVSSPKGRRKSKFKSTVSFGGEVEDPYTQMAAEFGLSRSQRLAMAATGALERANKMVEEYESVIRNLDKWQLSLRKRKEKGDEQLTAEEEEAMMILEEEIQDLGLNAKFDMFSPANMYAKDRERDRPSYREPSSPPRSPGGAGEYAGSGSESDVSETVKASEEARQAIVDLMREHEKKLYEKDVLVRSLREWMDDYEVPEMEGEPTTSMVVAVESDDENYDAELLKSLDVSFSDVQKTMTEHVGKVRNIQNMYGTVRDQLGMCCPENIMYLMALLRNSEEEVERLTKDLEDTISKLHDTKTLLESNTAMVGKRDSQLMFLRSRLQREQKRVEMLFERQKQVALEATSADAKPEDFAQLQLAFRTVLEKNKELERDLDKLRHREKELEMKLTHAATAQFGRESAIRARAKLATLVQTMYKKLAVRSKALQELQKDYMSLLDTMQGLSFQPAKGDMMLDDRALSSMSRVTDDSTIAKLDEKETRHFATRLKKQLEAEKMKLLDAEMKLRDAQKTIQELKKQSQNGGGRGSGGRYTKKVLVRVEGDGHEVWEDTEFMEIQARVFDESKKLESKTIELTKALNRIRLNVNMPKMDSSQDIEAVVKKAMGNVDSLLNALKNNREKTDLEKTEELEERCQLLEERLKAQEEENRGLRGMIMSLRGASNFDQIANSEEFNKFASSVFEPNPNLSRFDAALERMERLRVLAQQRFEAKKNLLLAEREMAYSATVKMDPNAPPSSRPYDPNRTRSRRGRGDEPKVLHAGLLTSPRGYGPEGAPTRVDVLSGKMDRRGRDAVVEDPARSVIVMPPYNYSNITPRGALTKAGGASLVVPRHQSDSEGDGSTSESGSGCSSGDYSDENSSPSPLRKGGRRTIRRGESSSASSSGSSASGYSSVSDDQGNSKKSIPPPPPRAAQGGVASPVKPWQDRSMPDMQPDITLHVGTTGEIQNAEQQPLSPRNGKSPSERKSILGLDNSGELQKLDGAEEEEGESAENPPPANEGQGEVEGAGNATIGDGAAPVTTAVTATNDREQDNGGDNQNQRKHKTKKHKHRHDRHSKHTHNKNKSGSGLESGSDGKRLGKSQDQRPSVSNDTQKSDGTLIHLSSVRNLSPNKKSSAESSESDPDPKSHELYRRRKKSRRHRGGHVYKEESREVQEAREAYLNLVKEFRKPNVYAFDPTSILPFERHLRRQEEELERRRPLSHGAINAGYFERDYIMDWHKGVLPSVRPPTMLDAAVALLRRRYIIQQELAKDRTFKSPLTTAPGPDLEVKVSPMILQSSRKALPAPPSQPQTDGQGHPAVHNDGQPQSQPQVSGQHDVPVPPSSSRSGGPAPRARFRPSSADTNGEKHVDSKEASPREVGVAADPPPPGVGTSSQDSQPTHASPSPTTHSEIRAEQILFSQDEMGPITGWGQSGKERTSPLSAAYTSPMPFVGGQPMAPPPKTADKPRKVYGGGFVPIQESPPLPPSQQSSRKQHTPSGTMSTSGATYRTVSPSIATTTGTVISVAHAMPKPLNSEELVETLREPLSPVKVVLPGSVARDPPQWLPGPSVDLYKSPVDKPHESWQKAKTNPFVGRSGRAVSAENGGEDTIPENLESGHEETQSPRRGERSGDAPPAEEITSDYEGGAGGADNNGGYSSPDPAPITSARSGKIRKTVQIGGVQKPTVVKKLPLNQLNSGGDLSGAITPRTVGAPFPPLSSGRASTASIDPFSANANGEWIPNNGLPVRKDKFTRHTDNPLLRKSVPAPPMSSRKAVLTAATESGNSPSPPPPPPAQSQESISPEPPISDRPSSADRGGKLPPPPMSGRFSSSEAPESSEGWRSSLSDVGLMPAPPPPRSVAKSRSGPSPKELMVDVPIDPRTGSSGSKEFKQDSSINANPRFMQQKKRMENELPPKPNSSLDFSIKGAGAAPAAWPVEVREPTPIKLPPL